jgi:hypothetical protein
VRDDSSDGVRDESWGFYETSLTTNQVECEEVLDAARKCSELQ